MAETERLICASTDLVDGGKGVRFEVTKNGYVEPAFAIRHEGRVYAYVNRCSHVPVEIDWRPGEFFDESGVYLVCTTHGALYAPDSGRCVEGKCKGRGLKCVPVRETAGGVFLIEEGGSGVG